MGGDNNHGVLFFIEQDTLDAAGNFADLRAVLKIISEAHLAVVATKEEQGVAVVDVGILINLEGAEDDVSNHTFTRVLADGCHASVSAPHSYGSLQIARDHSGTVLRESDHLDGCFVDRLH